MVSLPTSRTTSHNCQMKEKTTRNDKYYNMHRKYTENCYISVAGSSLLVIFPLHDCKWIVLWCYLRYFGFCLGLGYLIKSGNDALWLVIIIIVVIVILWWRRACRVEHTIFIEFYCFSWLNKKKIQCHLRETDFANMFFLHQMLKWKFWLNKWIANISLKIVLQ